MDYLKRLWQLAEAEHKGLKQSVFLALLGVISGLLPYWLVGQILNGLFNGKEDYGFYLGACLLALLGYVLKAVLYGKALATSHRSTFAVLKNVRIMLLEKLPKLSLGRIMDVHSGELKTNIVDQVEKMERPLAHLLPEMTANILGPVFIFIYLLILDWRMALLSLVSIPLALIFMGLIMRDYPQDYAQSVVVNTQMNESIVEYVSGIKVIKTFNQGDKFYGKFAERVRANAAYYYNWMKKCQLFMSLGRTIAPTTLITILPLGWLMYINGSLEMANFITTIILSLGIAGPLMAAMTFVDSLAQVGTTVSHIDEILQAPEQVHPEQPVNLAHKDIELSHVHFAYQAGQEVLHDVNLSIPEKSFCAFVGPSGSGKSTLAKLIAGFWDLEKGSISIGGYDLRELPLKQIYDLVAFVSQDTFLFNETVMENIRMGRPEASDAEVIAVAKASGCHDFIMQLEEGYSSIVGRGGNHLSGGERQRITIARAMLKNAPIIILDEATAYIDPENERLLQEAIARLVKDKTLLLIAHRLSTVVEAKQIFVIADGRLLAQGRHTELLARNDLYKSMWDAHMGRKQVA